MARRTVITGIGWVTPLGYDIEEVWGKLLRCESGIAPITRPALRMRVASSSR